MSSDPFWQFVEKHRPSIYRPQRSWPRYLGLATAWGLSEVFTSAVNETWWALTPERLPSPKHEDTQALVRAVREAPALDVEGLADDVLTVFCQETARTKAPIPPPAVFSHYIPLVQKLVQDAIGVLQPPPQYGDAVDYARWRDQARRYLNLAQDEQTFERIAFPIVAALLAFTKGLPSFGDGALQVGVREFVARADVIEGLVAPFFSSPDLFPGLQSQMKANGEERGEFVPPSKSRLEAQELPKRYLAQTPFEPLFDLTVPFSVTKNKELHGAIYAHTGWGKTQLLQHLIFEMLHEPDPPAMIIIDSKGIEHGMMRRFEKLALFAEPHLRDRLVLIDCDAAESPALNLFGMDLGDESTEAQIIELYEYIFAAFRTGLTGKQAGAFGYVVRLLKAHGNASLSTMLDLMHEGSDAKGAFDYTQSAFYPTIQKLDPLSQRYFATKFFGKTNVPMRSQVADRLFTLLQGRKFAQMFNAPENKLNLVECLREKKIVFVNTSFPTLGEASSIFGRFIVALALRAAFQRPVDSPPAVVLCDEAYDLFDENFNRILIQSRQFGLFLWFATQHYDQIPHQLRGAINGGCEMKFAGGLSPEDCRTLAAQMRTTPQLLASTRKTKGKHTEFACHLDGMEQAVKVTIPFGTVENAPQMDELTCKAMSAAIRRKYAAATHTHSPSPKPPHTDPNTDPSITPDTEY